MTQEQFIWFVTGVVQAEKDNAMFEGKKVNPDMKPADIEWHGPIRTIMDALERLESKKDTTNYKNDI